LPQGGNFLSIGPSNNKIRSNAGHLPGHLSSTGLGNGNGGLGKICVPLSLHVALVDLKTSEVTILEIDGNNRNSHTLCCANFLRLAVLVLNTSLVGRLTSVHLVGSSSRRAGGRRCTVGSGGRSRRAGGRGGGGGSGGRAAFNGERSGTVEGIVGDSLVNTSALSSRDGTVVDNVDAAPSAIARSSHTALAIRVYLARIVDDLTLVFKRNLVGNKLENLVGVPLAVLGIGAFHEHKYFISLCGSHSIIKR